MKTIIITNDPGIAQDAEQAGVNRIMVDLESHGKKERQASRSTFISTHQNEDIGKIRECLSTAQLIVRINPWHEKSPDEIDYVVAKGVDLVMLPMITSLDEVALFLKCLAGRAAPLPLIETAYSMAHIHEIAQFDVVKEVFIGLNDLHLSLGLDFLFEPLGLGLIDWMALQIKQSHKAFGFGGIAMLGSGELPAESILAEHARLGSTGVILSSRFCSDVDITQVPNRSQRISTALAALQQKYQMLLTRSVQEQQSDAEQTSIRIKALSENARKNRMIINK